MALLGAIYEEKQRTMYDVDLLVRETDLPKAERVLRSLGYEFSPEGVGCSYEFARQFMGEIPYVLGPMVIELHWHLVAPLWYRRVTNFDLDGIWDRAVPIDIEGAPAYRLCLEDEIIHLCYHLAIHHGLAHRTGYQDIIRVIHSASGHLDWSVLAERACAWRVSVACWAALRAAHQFDPETVPAEALDAFHVPKWRQRMILPLIKRALSGRPVLTSGSMRFLGIILIDQLYRIPGVLIHGLFPGRDWIHSRFDLSERQARWRQVTYPLEVIWRGLSVLFKRVHPR